MAENTLEAFGMTRGQMEEANQRAADQMLPIPYNIPGEEAPVQEDRFGDTAEWAAKDVWEEAKRRFQVRGTDEGAAGAFPEADSGVLNTFATGLGYAADMGLAGLEASDAAWKYSVGLASELIPGMDKNQERRFTRDVSSIPEAFAGNVFGINAGVPLPTASQASTGVRMATGDVLDAMPEYDPTRVNIFGGLGATDPGYTQSGRKVPESTGADGKYRFEMDDSNISVVPYNVTVVRFNPNATPKIPTNSNISTLGDIMVADELFYQYPDIQNIPVVFNSSFDPSLRGSVYNNNIVALNSDFLQKPPEELKKTLIHEIQHLIQGREGFAQGTSPENRDVLTFARGEIDSPENTQAWAEYSQDLANYRKNENLVEPLQKLKNFYGSFAARNDFLLAEPRMLQRVARRLRNRDSELPVQLNLISDVKEVEDLLETLDSANPEYFDYFSGRVSSLLKRANTLAGDQNADILEETLDVNPAVFKPGYTSDILEYFIPTPAPTLPDLPPPGGSPDTSVLFRTYERKRGEVEARNAADRMSMTLEERLKTSPESTEDPRIPRPYQWGDPSNLNQPSSSVISDEVAGKTNLDAWSEGAYFKDPVTGQPQTLYHGMGGTLRGEPVEFMGENFEPSYQGTLGPGTYLTTDPEVASNFATGQRGGYTDQKFGGQVFPVYTNVTRVFDDSTLNSDSFKNIRQELADLIEENTDDPYVFSLADKLRNDEELSVGNLFTRVEDGKVRGSGVGFIVSDFLESVGFEGISTITDKGFHEAVIFPGHSNLDFPKQSIKSALQGPEGRYSRETNDMRFAKGGLAVDNEMKTMMAEGGIKDDGMNRDPVSGNEIPAGSLAEEVRDDVDAKLSSGEYVVPADVVRFFGVDYFEKLRNKAKMGLEKMEADGRIGGEPAPMDDDLPFSDEELMSVEDTPVGMAEGGSVTSGLDPQQFQPGFSFGMTPSASSGASTVSKTFTNAAGEIRSILFVNGQPVVPIPEGFYEDVPENTQRAIPTTATSVAPVSNNDRDRPAGVIPTSSEGNDTKFGGFMSEDDIQKLTDDPLAFGSGALKGDEFFSAKRTGSLGALAGPAGMVAGSVVGGGMELENIARARAALLLAQDQGLEDTEGYKNLQKEIDSAVDDLSGAGKLLNLIGFGSGEGYADRVGMASETTQAIPTAGTSTRTSGTSTRTSGTSSSALAPTSSIRPSSLPTRNSGDVGPSAASKAASDYQARVSSSGASSVQDYAQATKAPQKTSNTGSGTSGTAMKNDSVSARDASDPRNMAKGGLVSKPKKKPVAKK